MAMYNHNISKLLILFMSRAFVYGVIVSTLKGESVKLSSSFLVTPLAINSYLFYALHFFP